MSHNDIQSVVATKTDLLPVVGTCTSSLVTIFSLPKSFNDSTISRIQSNAIRSWSLLGPQVDVVLLGKDPGISEFAKSNGFRHDGGGECNEFGTPILSDAFSRVRQLSSAPFLMYCNADVILRGEVVAVVNLLQHDSRFQRFLAFGRRIDMRLNRLVNWNDNDDQSSVDQEGRRSGTKGPVVCKEYFLFPRDLFVDIHPFAVGRGNWDNWMVAHAKANRIPVINISQRITALHQKHGYSHVHGSQLRCYVTGEEAINNQRLAGGRNVIRGSSAEWRLTKTDIRPISMSWANPEFWLDLPKFLRMLIQMPWER
jgi:hypothetical protein